MPCGAVLAASPLSLRALAAPGTPPSSLCITMAALHHHHHLQHQEDVFLENGLLSYENPNYHLDPATLARNALALGKDVDDDEDDYIDNRTRSDRFLSDKDDVADDDEKTHRDLATSEKDEIPRSTVGPDGDLYAVPVRRRPPKCPRPRSAGSSPERAVLPPGWERHQDDDGPYYWHIKSGTIQREPPPRPNAEDVVDSAPVDRRDGRKRDESALKRRSCPARPEPEAGAVRFFVRSLGWVEIAEEDLTPEKSSRAVNRCIVDLSLGRNDLLDAVGRWGDGKDLYMDLDEGALKLTDPDTSAVLHSQPIHTIRVWGVGRDNGRDFAYVARDRTTRRHMCHVFRCDMPARTIANALRDICKRIMIERSLQGPPARPTDLPTERRRPGRSQVRSFPTPMEEPKKVLRACYLGSAEVRRATGMDVLNDAIDTLTANAPRDTWKPVDVAVAPSMISILQRDDSVAAECRVRYLSFLGIGRDVRKCAFVMHTAQDLFVAHVFHCEPSSGALCKTIEAACKLRYQKCLDAHPGAAPSPLPAPPDAAGNSAGIGATLKSLVGSLTSRKTS